MSTVERCRIALSRFTLAEWVDACGSQFQRRRELRPSATIRCRRPGAYGMAMHQECPLPVSGLRRLMRTTMPTCLEASQRGDSGMHRLCGVRLSAQRGARLVAFGHHQRVTKFTKLAGTHPRWRRSLIHPELLFRTRAYTLGSYLPMNRSNGNSMNFGTHSEAEWHTATDQYADALRRMSAGDHGAREALLEAYKHLQTVGLPVAPPAAHPYREIAPGSGGLW